MKAPISGIVTGFRIKKGVKDSSDFAELDIVQPGDKTDQSALIIVYVQTLQAIEYLLTNYSTGQLKWIDIFAKQIPSGREMVWVCVQIFNLTNEEIPVIGRA